LLVKKVFYAIYFTRVVVDFIIFAQYYLYDEKTLKYIKHALYRINIFKKNIYYLRSIIKVCSNEYFNFPKFYVIIHYLNFIRLYGAVNNFDIKYSETIYKYFIKEYYFKTNKRFIY